MRSSFMIVALAALSLKTVDIASAATLRIGSYGATNASNNSGYVNPGFSNTAVTFGTGGASTFNIGTGGGIWTAPTGGSSWVAQNPGDCPSCGNVEVNATYSFFSTFQDLTPGTSSGTITVMADDTTAVYLNGTLITPAAGAATAGKCTAGTPNCTIPTTYNLTGFVSGSNVLRFDVQQIYASAEGIDFSGTINTTQTPEPSSIALLGTGLLGVGAAVRRRVS